MARYPAPRCLTWETGAVLPRRGSSAPRRPAPALGPNQQCSVFARDWHSDSPPLALLHLEASLMLETEARRGDRDSVKVCPEAACSRPRAPSLAGCLEGLAWVRSAACDQRLPGAGQTRAPHRAELSTRARRGPSLEQPSLGPCTKTCAQEKGVP